MDNKYVRWLRTCVLLAAAIALTACVTINIYFPAAAAEKAADKVIDEIWQTPAGQTPAAAPGSSSHPGASSGPGASSSPAPAVAPTVNQESAP